jgi:hypothetical protein
MIRGRCKRTLEHRNFELLNTLPHDDVVAAACCERQYPPRNSPAAVSHGLNAGGPRQSARHSRKPRAGPAGSSSATLAGMTLHRFPPPWAAEEMRPASSINRLSERPSSSVQQVPVTVRRAQDAAAATVAIACLGSERQQYDRHPVSAVVVPASPLALAHGTTRRRIARKIEATWRPAIQLPARIPCPAAR